METSLQKPILKRLRVYAPYSTTVFVYFMGFLRRKTEIIITFLKKDRTFFTHV